MKQIMQQQIEVIISDDPLQVNRCMSFVQDQACGGTAIFVGTVRDKTSGKEVTALEFESYIPMAEKEMHKIATTICEQWSAVKVCIHHRIGRLEIGGIAVIIAVSTPHRAAAFAACQYGIDTLKATVPIWKKEIFKDGEIWVAAHP